MPYGWFNNKILKKIQGLSLNLNGELIHTFKPSIIWLKGISKISPIIFFAVPYINGLVVWYGVYL
jgi:hypothetical protein